MTSGTDQALGGGVRAAGGPSPPASGHDLAESAEVETMLLLDLDAARAAAVADGHGGGKARADRVDARDADAFAAAIGDADVLVNTASYRVNLEAMRACLQAGCNYLDLGGLYWMTGQQLELDDDFKRAGLLAVLGIGSSPGKTKVLAARAVGSLGDEPIESIEVMAGGRDPVAHGDGRLRPPYAVQTLLDELTMAPVVLRDGIATEIEPLADGGVVDYGDPIGEGETIYTLHSELRTFGSSFGCHQASFRLSLAPALLEELKRLATAPREAIELAAREAATPSAETVSVHLIRAATESGRTVTVRALSRPHFGLGGSIVSTAAPAAATVRLFARGSLSATGVLPPELCIDPEELFAELETRGCRFSLAES
jgi:saccharopine dehydrogenase-like NADP-dependent oxidoreductase